MRSKAWADQELDGNGETLTLAPRPLNRCTDWSPDGRAPKTKDCTRPQRETSNSMINHLAGGHPGYRTEALESAWWAHNSLPAAHQRQVPHLPVFIHIALHTVLTGMRHATKNGRGQGGRGMSMQNICLVSCMPSHSLRD